MHQKENIYVTKPFLPPLEEYTELLKSVWESHILTNSGPLEQRLNDELKRYLAVENLTLTTNATTGLILAFLALRLEKKVLTTPFTFPATLHALSIIGLEPVFADVDIDTGLLTKETIETHMEADVTAVLCTTAFGQPIDTSTWTDFKSQSKLKLVIDAAPAFGALFGGQDFLKNVDAAIYSFHATKIFNTFEGGAVITSDKEVNERINSLKNFGFDGPDHIREIGINGKMSEGHAALGIINLKYIDDCIRKRKLVFKAYCQRLSSSPHVQIMNIFSSRHANYAYLPIKCLLGSKHRELIKIALAEQNIFARKYYYPLLSNILPYRHLSSACVKNLPNANFLSNTILCLPIYPDLEEEKINHICNIILST